MRIEEINRKLQIETELSEKDIAWYDAAEDIFVKYGIVSSDEDYLRLPRTVAKSVSEGVADLCDNTSGVRVRLSTDSCYIAIKAVSPSSSHSPKMPLTGRCGFDLYKEFGGQQFFVGTYIPYLDKETGYESIIYTGNTTGKAVNYIINFPTYNPVTKLYIGLKEGSRTETPDVYANEKPVVFYGSSITQGGCASRPGNIYQNILSRALNMDYLCLGFSGRAMGEKEIAEYMAGLDMCAFVSDYDHNAPNSEYLKNTHFALYETIRNKNPDIPYIMITHPSKGINEATLRRTTVMESFIKAVDRGDKNIYFIDGDSLFAGDEYDSCTVDGCHPNDLGFYRMARGILPILKEILYLG
ncbi:MAG: SGNH/GDSL hydrolase family protein [Firmicutes bacterium]|nr:SGNH/GDSL hydrolase family protein [Bacillota bacterium]